MTYEPTARDIKRRVRIARAQIEAGGYKTRAYRSISRPLTEEDQTERVDVAARVGRILDAADANNLGVAKDAMRDFIAAYGLGRPFACRQCQNRYEWPGELDDHVLLSHRAPSSESGTGRTVRSSPRRDRPRPRPTALARGAGEVG